MEALSSTINFGGNITGTKIIVNGNSTSTGIYANDSSLQINGTTNTNLNEYNNLISFTKGQTSGPDGYKIDWIGTGTLAW
jgi:hypothetical protein